MPNNYKTIVKELKKFSPSAKVIGTVLKKYQALQALSAEGIACSAIQSTTIYDTYSKITSPASAAFTNDNLVGVAGYNHLKVVYVNPHPELNSWVRVSKRIFDVLFSVIVMLLGLPVFAMLYLVTKFSSKGPAFFKQERMGKNERKFYIYKFRSMYVDAEKAGPQLSSADDPRITAWGRVIRRTRLDELPQFWNVLKGDMSVVGPRPERQYFIEKIVEKNPDYRKLQRLKPGVTSMGQVHYGYAENVDQMCARMVYDLKYLQNPTIKSDLKVIAKTITVMLQCKGK